MVWVGRLEVIIDKEGNLVKIINTPSIAVR